MIKEHNDEFVDKEIAKLKEMQKQGQDKEALLKLNQLISTMPDSKKLLDFLIETQKNYRKIEEKNKDKELKELAAQLKTLIEAGELEKALDKCSELLNSNSKNADIINLCRKARWIVIDKKLESKKSLFDSNKYEDILNFLYGLKRIESTHKGLEKLIRNTNAKLYAKQMDEKRDFILKAKEDINYLYQMSKYEECVKAANELLHMDPKNSFAKRMIAKAGKKFDSKVRKELLAQMKEHKLQVDPNKKDEYIKI
ncbi:MAG: hypothetical protein WCT36_03905 [Candidatus Gracilibacteria bacterium]